MANNDVYTVGGTIGIGFVDVLLEQAVVSDTIIINLFPEYYDFANRFVGFNFVYPGMSRYGSFTIQNDTGSAYLVTDYAFHADSVGFQRTYNGMAQGLGLSLAEVAAYPADAWYNLNVEYYGAENLDDLDTLRRMFGHYMTGPGSAGGYGVNVGPEDSPGMIALAQDYLYKQCQFSFNTDEYPIDSIGLSGAAVTLWDYVNKTAENRDIVLGRVFSQPIQENGFTSPIGYTNDNAGIGNVCNGAYVDFMFTLTLSIVEENTVTVTYSGNNNTGGTAPVDGNSYALGSIATVLGNTGGLTRAGYVFAGWNTAPDGSGTTYAAGDTIVMLGNIVLFARWIAQPQPPQPKPCKTCGVCDRTRKHTCRSCGTASCAISRTHHVRNGTRCGTPTTGRQEFCPIKRRVLFAINDA